MLVSSTRRPVLIKINDKRSKSEKRRLKNIILKCGSWLKTSEEEEEEEEKKRKRDMQRFPPESKEKKSRVCAGHKILVVGGKVRVMRAV